MIDIWLSKIDIQTMQMHAEGILGCNYLNCDWLIDWTVFFLSQFVICFENYLIDQNSN